MVFSSKKKKENKTHLKKSENKKNSNSKRTNKRKNKGLRKRTKNKKGGAKSPLIASPSTILSLIEHMDKELEFLNRDDSTVTYIQCRQCLKIANDIITIIEKYIPDDEACKPERYIPLLPISDNIQNDNKCSLYRSLEVIKKHIDMMTTTKYTDFRTYLYLPFIRLHHSLNCLETLVFFRIHNLMMYSIEKIKTSQFTNEELDSIRKEIDSDLFENNQILTKMFIKLISLDYTGEKRLLEKILQDSIASASQSQKDLKTWGTELLNNFEIEQQRSLGRIQPKSGTSYVQELNNPQLYKAIGVSGGALSTMGIKKSPTVVLGLQTGPSPVPQPLPLIGGLSLAVTEPMSVLRSQAPKSPEFTNFSEFFSVFIKIIFNEFILPSIKQHLEKELRDDIELFLIDIFGDICMIIKKHIKVGNLMKVNGYLEVAKEIMIEIKERFETVFSEINHEAVIKSLSDLKFNPNGQKTLLNLPDRIRQDLWSQIKNEKQLIFSYLLKALVLWRLPKLEVDYKVKMGILFTANFDVVNFWRRFQANQLDLKFITNQVVTAAINSQIKDAPQIVRGTYNAYQYLSWFNYEWILYEWINIIIAQAKKVIEVILKELRIDIEPILDSVENKLAPVQSSLNLLSPLRNISNNNDFLGYLGGEGLLVNYQVKERLNQVKDKKWGSDFKKRVFHLHNMNPQAFLDDIQTLYASSEKSELEKGIEKKIKEFFFERNTENEEKNEQNKGQIIEFLELKKEEFLESEKEEFLESEKAEIIDDLCLKLELKDKSLDIMILKFIEFIDKEERKHKEDTLSNLLTGILKEDKEKIKALLDSEENIKALLESEEYNWLSYDEVMEKVKIFREIDNYLVSFFKSKDLLGERTSENILKKRQKYFDIIILGVHNKLPKVNDIELRPMIYKYIDLKKVNDIELRPMIYKYIDLKLYGKI